MFINQFKSLLYKDIIRRNKVTPFVIFVFFIISFTIARIVVLVFPNLNLFIGEFHIHHFYYGIVLLFISNWMSLVSDDKKINNIAAALTGVGLGLIIDEAGLLLTCSSPDIFICNYWSRATYDVLIWFGGSLLAILYLGPFLKFIHVRIIDIKDIFTKKIKF